MRRPLLLLLGLLVAATGCGIADPILLSADPTIAAFKEKYATPKAYRVELAPVEMANAREPGKDGWVLKLDKERLARDTAETLKIAGVFEDIWYGDGGENPADLRLHLKVTGAVGRYEGTNGNAVAGFILWWGFSSLLGCLVADEDYSAAMDIEASLTDLKTNEVLWQDTLNAKFQGSLSHYQKGIHIFDLIWPGPVAATHDPDSVTEVLAPHLQRQYAIDLATKLAEGVPKPPTPPVDLCLVLSRDAKGKTYASSDAGKFGRAFSRGRPTAEIRTLTAGTPEALLGAIAELAAKKDMTVRDLAFYYAGPGTVVAQGGKFLPALALGEGASLLVDDLLKALAAVGAESRAVVLDAAFLGDKGRVAKSTAAVPPDAELAWPTGGPGCLFAAGAGIATDKIKGGILTSFLVKEQISAADADNNGKITLAEANQHVGWPVSRAVRRAGGRGAPFLQGDGILFRIGK